MLSRLVDGFGQKGCPSKTHGFTPDVASPVPIRVDRIQHFHSALILSVTTKYDKGIVAFSQRRRDTFQVTA